jgi:two-component system, chemotaxis family, chemotaxis protein CheY
MSPSLTNAETEFEALKVLVIEDQAFMRQVIVTMLRSLGITEIYEASDGGDGLKTTLERNPDLILCDIEMQPIDGVVFLTTLRKSNNGQNKTPVVFLTGHSDSSMVKKAKELGVDSFLVKPVSALLLKKHIRIVLNKKSAVISPPATA